MLINGVLAKLAGSILVVGMMMQSQCTGVHGSAKVTGGNHQSTDYQADVNGGWRFLTPINNTPEYHFSIQGYPHNRLLISGYWVKTDYTQDSPVITKTPMSIQIGATFPFSVTVGAKELNYTGKVIASSDLPAGTYVLDAPGAIAQVQYWMNYYPDANTASINLSSSSSGDGIAALLSSADRLTDYTGTSSVQIDLDSQGVQAWRTLVTKDPDLGGNPFYTWHDGGSH